MSSYLVLGFSIAGIGAALQLARSRKFVHLVNLASEFSLTEQSVISPTEINRSSMPSREFERFSISLLHDSGIDLIEFADHLAIHSGGIQFSSMSGENKYLPADGVIYAPNGSFSKQELLPDQDALVGFGLSYSARSDGAFCRNRPVVVVGSGDWSLDQALVLSEFTRQITLVCSDEPRSSPRLRSQISELGVEKYVTATVGAVSRDADGRIVRVRIDKDGREKWVESSAIFVAYEPRIDWLPLGGSAIVNGDSRLRKAGLPNGISYVDHHSLYNDGVRVAASLAS